MVFSVMRTNKNKYTRELGRLLLVHLPPKNGKCFGLTGNFLPIIVTVRSRRKFSKLKGWFWTEYAATNKYTKLSERMHIERVDENILRRLYWRYKTTKVPTVIIQKDIYNEYNPKTIIYITLLTKKNITLIYINQERYNKLLSLPFLRSPISAKKFIFYRYKTRIINYVTDNLRILRIMTTFNKRSSFSQQ